MLVKGSKSDFTRERSKIQLFKNIGRVHRQKRQEIINRKQLSWKHCLFCIQMPYRCSETSKLFRFNYSTRRIIGAPWKQRFSAIERTGKELCSFLHSDYAVPRGTPCIWYTGEQARERTAQCASRLGVIADGPYLVMFTTQIAIKHAYRSVPCPRRTLTDLSIRPRRFFLVVWSSPDPGLFSIQRWNLVVFGVSRVKCVHVSRQRRDVFVCMHPRSSCRRDECTRCFGTPLRSFGVSPRMSNRAIPL